MIKRICFYLFFISHFSALAQITIAEPLNNGVYQRNSVSQANLSISGTYSQTFVSSIQARLVDTTNQLPISGFDWTTIHNLPVMGYFRGQLVNVPAGWYILEIRAIYGGTVVETATLNRVGIGDVFMIAGQSNAQGYFLIDPPYTPQGIGAEDDRVITHDNGIYCSSEDLPFPTLTKLTQYVKPGTAGRAAWAYGKLGDEIVAKTGFPVVFYNSGASGASSENWKVSSDGLPTNNPFTNITFCTHPGENQGRPWSVGMPYSNFKRGLNYYNSMFGARSILWHQGESDNYLDTVTTTQYQNNLNYLITKSRTDFNAGLPWVIARASYINNSPSAAIIAAQTNIINPSNQIFAGPSTDAINNNTVTGSRDGINLHFIETIGLLQLAYAWSSFLDSAYFTSSTPVIAQTSPSTSVTVSGSNVILSVPNTYASYKWIRTDITGNSNFGNTSEGGTNTITRTTGTYRCWVATANGNQHISNPINVDEAIIKTNNGNSCSGNVYLSDLKYKSATNGQGPFEKDKTNGSSIDGDGVPIIMKGLPYPKGIGVASNSSVEYQIPSNQYYRLRTTIGVGDEINSTCNNTGGMTFKVYGNGNLIYTSPTIYKNSLTQDVNLPIFNYSTIKLEVIDEIANATCNKGIWADARLLCFLGDSIPPTNISNLQITDTLSKCLRYTWSPATDDNQVNGYYIYVNNAVIDTIAPTQTSYTLSGLSSGTLIKFGVKAFDLINNLSPDTISVTISTINPEILYADQNICSNRSYLPTIHIPKGGIFSLTDGPAATINASTGLFFTTNTGGFFGDYTFGQSIAGCQDLISFSLGTTTPPVNTPTVTIDKNIINTGTIVNFASNTTCASDQLIWSFSPLNSQTLPYSPPATNTFYAACKKELCFNYSNNVTVTVLPNCASSLNLTNANNLSNNINSLYYASSNTINAVNQISPANNVEYRAGQSVLLGPGFKVDAGVIFSAKIQNCP
jgi:hypothetical protein